ncbi:MAG TPA: urea ABC transporter permease subunit UrtB [Methylomirabilota bacterium]|nr:urea ABC transporter permease subunit UrtB [Methylomirabilota bacterium]
MPARLLSVFLLALFSLCASAAPAHRDALVKAILSEDLDEQITTLRTLSSTDDAFVQQALAAWRQGSVYLYDSNDTRIPFLLDAAVDAEGRAKGLTVADGRPFVDSSGKPLLFLPAEITPADTSSKLRKAIKTTLDLFALNNPDNRMRRDAVTKIGQEQNPEYIPFLQARLTKEADPQVKRALAEAVAITELAAEDPATRLKAIVAAGTLNSINSLSFLKSLQADAEANKTKLDAASLAALRKSIYDIEQYIWRGNMFGTAFRGLSLGAVLLVAALGLAITFGLMGVINMAHGEVMMVGAYSAFVVQNYFTRWFGPSGAGFDSYFLAALAVSFLAAATVGLLLERGIIRFLYKRPLESLLATWGVSLVLQQLFRHIFGAANVQVSSPSWLSGSFEVQDVLLAYNRIFVIGFAGLIVLATYLLLTRTSLGLQIRAVMQNRAMASCLGVRVDRVNMMTFAFGSGLAGMAGACLSQIGNVGPSLGQNYIVDCFMVVVLGGVGNLVGTIAAAFGIGMTDQMLQPVLGAVMGKIIVLAGIILFLQWRPAGLFVTRTRNLEG